MVKNNDIREPEALACEVCLEEIPATVADHAEGEEYLAHFCGLECYRQWREKENLEIA